MKHLVIDISNLLFRVSAAHTAHNIIGTPEEQAGLAMHSALITLNSHYKQVKPDQVALSFEGPNNWRKAYTLSDSCVSKRKYKGNRVKDASMEPFFELIKSFEELVRNHSSIICLSNPVLEGDDLFAGYAQYHTQRGDEVVGLSGDKDFIQLLKLKNFTLLNPDKLGAQRNIDKKTGDVIDPHFFMFEKAFRGDSGDNVMSAFPRVRSSRLKKAFTDEYERTNIMNHTWKFNEPATGEEREFRVGDLFEENNLLMNLEAQPPHIREEIFKTVESAALSSGNFSLFHFQKFAGKHNLKKISESAMQFVDLFSSTGLKSPVRAEKAQLAESKRNTLQF